MKFETEFYNQLCEDSEAVKGKAADIQMSSSFRLSEKSAAV